MPSNMFRYILVLFMLTIVTVLGQQLSDGGSNDICGDPLPNGDDPRTIIQYLMDTDDTKKTIQYLDKHPFVMDAEDGKMDRARMTTFIVNYALHLERFNRNLASALNAFGSAWPVVERRELLQMMLNAHRERLQRLDVLAQAFGIDTIEKLVQQEPNPSGLILASHTAEIVMHAYDISELTAAIEVRLGVESGLHARIKVALMTNAAYKPWKLGADALRFFDWDMLDMGQVKNLNDAILKRAVDEKMDLCFLRRRMAQVNNGDIFFWDAANVRTAPTA